MSKALDDYFVEYVESNGTYLKLQKNEEESFQSDDFQKLQMNMIQSNYIPRLLPITFEDINNQMTVFYKIEGLRPLRLLTKEHPLTMQEYYSFFINLIQTLQDAAHNMLTERHFVLNEEYIYIGNGYHDVYLTYLPIEEINTPSSIYEDLKKLLLSLASDVQGLNGSQFKMILNYIKDPGFSLQGIKKVLRQLQDKSGVEDDQGVSQQEDRYETKQVRSLPPLEQKLKIYSILIGVVLLAIIWKIYEGSESIILLIVSSLLSLAVIAGVIVYWFVWRPGVEPIMTEKQVKVKAKPAPSEQNSEANKQASTKQKEKPTQLSSESSEPSNQTAQQVDGFELQEAETAATFELETEDDTTIGRAAEATHDETMLLDESEMLDEPKVSEVANYLLVNREDAEEKIDLEADNFVIGRSEKGVSYVEQSVGVSRMHIEFVKLSDTYGVKDLGSRNGTYINQEKIIPYKIHELTEEDEIQVGKTTYIYKVSYD